jgi:hypothetical protein
VKVERVSFHKFLPYLTIQCFLVAYCFENLGKPHGVAIIDKLESKVVVSQYFSKDCDYLNKNGTLCFGKGNINQIYGKTIFFSNSY